MPLDREFENGRAPLHVFDSSEELLATHATLAAARECVPAQREKSRQNFDVSDGPSFRSARYRFSSVMDILISLFASITTIELRAAPPRFWRGGLRIAMTEVAVDER
jgi:hypothetical protein